MEFVDTDSYNEMISALEKFKADVSEQCATMTSAGHDCIDNTDNDPAAVNANSKISECVQKIQSSVEMIDEIITILNQQLEDVENNYNRANQ